MEICPKCGRPKIEWDVVQGDSRKLSELLRERGLAGVVSPPFLNANIKKEFKTEEELEKFAKEQWAFKHGRSLEATKKYLEKNWKGYSSNPNNIGNLKDKGLAAVVSPPYGDQVPFHDKEFMIKSAEERSKRIKEGKAGGHYASPEAIRRGAEKIRENYSNNPDNIGNLPDKGLVGITSPPYKNIEIGKGLNTKPPRYGKKDQSGRNPKSPSQTETKYSPNPDNIANLPDKKLAGVTSPPYATRMDGGCTEKGYSHIKPYDSEGKPDDYRKRWPTDRDGKNIGNLMEGVEHQNGRESYLQAMLKTYQESYRAGISPLVTVTKNPTRDGKLRRLDLDTCKLLQIAGYEIVDYHKALLFTEHKQKTLTGDVKKEVKGRLSFFKRLSLQKGNVVAQFEDVIFAVIPN